MGLFKTFRHSTEDKGKIPSSPVFSLFECHIIFNKRELSWIIISLFMGKLANVPLQSPVPTLPNSPGYPRVWEQSPVCDMFTIPLQRTPLRIQPFPPFKSPKYFSRIGYKFSKCVFNVKTEFLENCQYLSRKETLSWSGKWKKEGAAFFKYRSGD